jgi:hypothetical protein
MARNLCIKKRTRDERSRDVSRSERSASVHALTLVRKVNAVKPGFCHARRVFMLFRAQRRKMPHRIVRRPTRLYISSSDAAAASIASMMHA